MSVKAITLSSFSAHRTWREALFHQRLTRDGIDRHSWAGGKAHGRRRSSANGSLSRIRSARVRSRDASCWHEIVEGGGGEGEGQEGEPARRMNRGESRGVDARMNLIIGWSERAGVQGVGEAVLGSISRVVSPASPRSEAYH